MDRASTSGRIAFANHTLRRVAVLALALVAPFAAPVAAAGAAPLPAPSIIAQTNQATPAFWEVRDGDTTIYLFGTFHALDQQTVWFDRSIRDAFDRSGELVLETIAPTDPREVRAIGRAVIGPRPATASFIGQTRAVVAQGRSAGLSIDRGADAVLRRAATDQGKKIVGIELFADQLRTFANISAAAAASPPPSAPVASASVRSPVTLDALLVAWKAGDALAYSDMLAGFEADAPHAYRLLISDRNALYGQWIADRLALPGTVFVAVGAGHLAGKDSIQNWLGAKGLHARRLEQLPNLPKAALLPIGARLPAHGHPWRRGGHKG